MNLVAITTLVLALVASPAAPPVLPFIEDDYAAALSRARATKVPLFVEAWAPW